MMSNTSEIKATPSVTAAIIADLLVCDIFTEVQSNNSN